MKAPLSIPVLALISGCSLLQAKQPLDDIAPVKPPPTVAIEQTGFGQASRFQVCEAPECAKPSLKTMDAISSAPLPVRQIAAAFSPKPVAPAPAAPPSDATEAGQVIVRFAFGKSVLDGEALEQLHAILPSARAAQKIIVHGYTDNVGALPVNDALAMRRAVSVKRYLVGVGVKSRIIKLASGKCCYMAENKDEAGRALNRRASIEIITKGNS